MVEIKIYDRNARVIEIEGVAIDLITLLKLLLARWRMNLL